MPFIDIEGVVINFPFDPYACQSEYMKQLIKCLKERKNAVLESPTGTGKTLCLLCGTLAWLEDKKAEIAQRRFVGADPSTQIEGLHQLVNSVQAGTAESTADLVAPRVIYASRTHTQLSQAIQELKRTPYAHFSVSVIGSREQMCLNEEVIRQERNHTRVHMCRNKVSSRTCFYYNNLEQSKHNFANEVLDIEELVNLGQKHKCCPYYTAKEMKNNADVIFMPYNYLLDPKTRKAHNIELNGNIIIFDEAHNVERMCEDSSSFDLTSVQLASALRELDHIADKCIDLNNQNEAFSDMDNESGATDFTLEDVLILKQILLDLEHQINTISLDVMSNKGKTFPGKYIFEILSKSNLHFGNKNPVNETITKIVGYLTNEGGSNVFNSKGDGLSKISEIIQTVFSSDPVGMDVDSHIELLSRHYKVHVIEVKPSGAGPGAKKKSAGWDITSTSSKSVRTLSYWCFSPGGAMQLLKAQGVRNVILTSGTLSPLPSFKLEMGLKFDIELENPHVIEPHQVWIGVTSKGPDGIVFNSSFKNRSNESYQSSLGNAIVNYASTVPNGMLLFFPSYPVMTECLATWQRLNIWNRIEQYKSIYVEPRNKHEFKTAMGNFYEKINDPTLNGAVFAAVCRGKVSEGLDFSDINGRAVIITGLPFPPRMDPKIVLKMQFLDEMNRSMRTGLTGQEWYRQQASRAVNQAIGRVIRHKQDYGAIILCDERFNYSQARKELPLWVRPRVKNCTTFTESIKGLKEFFQTASKLLPDPQAQSRKKNALQVGPLGCQGAYFESGTSRSKPTGKYRDVKASTFVNHSSGSSSSEFSLAKLKMQYDFSGDKSSSVKASSSKEKGLLSALSQQNSEQVSDTQVPSFQSTKATDLYQSQQAAARLKKKKIVLKATNEASSERTRNLESCSKYIGEVKACLSSENYQIFVETLALYKKKADFKELKRVLFGLFIGEDRKQELLIQFYQFVQPAHRKGFIDVCKEMLGPDCGIVEVARLTSEARKRKREALQSQESSGTDKKSKCEDRQTLEGIKTVELPDSNKRIITSSVSADQLKTHASKTSQPNLLNSNEPQQKLLPQPSFSKSQDSKVLLAKRPGAQPIKVPEQVSDVTPENNQKASNQCSNDSGSENQTSEAGLNKLSAATPDTSRVSLHRGWGVRSDDSVSSCFTGDPISDPSSLRIKDVYLRTAPWLNRWTCCYCKLSAQVPCKARCNHVCCLACWKYCVKEIKKCPECNAPVKRKYLSRVIT